MLRRIMNTLTSGAGAGHARGRSHGRHGGHNRKAQQGAAGLSALSGLLSRFGGGTRGRRRF